MNNFNGERLKLARIYKQSIKKDIVIGKMSECFKRLSLIKKEISLSKNIIVKVLINNIAICHILKRLIFIFWYIKINIKLITSPIKRSKIDILLNNKRNIPLITIIFKRVFSIFFFVIFITLG